MQIDSRFFQFYWRDRNFRTENRSTGAGQNAGQKSPAEKAWTE